MRHQGGRQQVVFQIKGEAFLAEHQRQEGKQVFGVQAGGIGRQLARQVIQAHHGHAVVGAVHLARYGQLTVATGFSGNVDNHATRFHGGHDLAADQRRRLLARNQRRGDDDVGLARVLGHQLGLTALVVVRHFLGVHTVVGLLLFIAHRYFDELAAQAFHLLFGGRAHVGGLHHRPQALGRGNGLQTRHTHPHDQHAGRLHGTGGGHQHRHEARVVVRRQQYRFIAGDVVLAGQHIHALRPRGTRQQLHGKGRHLARSQLREGGALERSQLADQHSALFQLGNGVFRQRAHGEHNVALPQHRSARCGQRCPCFHISRIRYGGNIAGTGLHHHGMTHGDELFHRFRCGGHAGFTCQPFGRNSDLHGLPFCKWIND